RHRHRLGGGGWRGDERDNGPPPPARPGPPWRRNDRGRRHPPAAPIVPFPVPARRRDQSIAPSSIWWTLLMKSHASSRSPREARNAENAPRVMAILRFSSLSRSTSPVASSATRAANFRAADVIIFLSLAARGRSAPAANLNRPVTGRAARGTRPT